MPKIKWHPRGGIAMKYRREYRIWHGMIQRCTSIYASIAVFDDFTGGTLRGFFPAHLTFQRTYGKLTAAELEKEGLRSPCYIVPCADLMEWEEAVQVVKDWDDSHIIPF